MINREGQVWKMTNMIGGWTVFVVTRSVEDMHVGIILDGEGPMAGSDAGKTIVSLEPPNRDPWETDVDDGERLRLA